jgi:hypothetical protein
MLSVALPPLHIDVLPLITLVGLALTVITALPDISPVCAVHFESISAETVYMDVVAGLTLAVYGLAVIPVTDTAVEPSV